MRVAAPEFGAVSLILLRMALGALLLVPLLLKREYLRLLRQNLGPLFVPGLTTAALPYTLLALATTPLEAGFSSLINAATPIVTALIGAAFFATTILHRQILGLTLAWGVVLLGETISLQVLVGMVVTLLGTGIATGVVRLRRKRQLSLWPRGSGVAELSPDCHVSALESAGVSVRQMQGECSDHSTRGRLPGPFCGKHSPRSGHCWCKRQADRGSAAPGGRDKLSVCYRRRWQRCFQGPDTDLRRRQRPGGGALRQPWSGERIFAGACYLALS